MRIYLLPISTRRTLIYCERLSVHEARQKSLVDRAVDKASTTWTNWERTDKGWKKSVTHYGSILLNRIPFEEWGLKTVPPLAKRKGDLKGGRRRVEVLYPGAFLEEGHAPWILERIATERQGLHRGKMWWSFGGMPLAAPFALIPIIPNFPFFYLAFRAWSHWRAWSGSKHLEFLLKNDLLKYHPSPILDQMYTAGLMHRSPFKSRAAPTPTPDQTAKLADNIDAEKQPDAKEVMLLRRWNGKLLADQLKLPNMEVEIERAVDQVERDIKAKEVEEAEDPRRKGEARAEAREEKNSPS
ncbi:hypothetical protein P152DRAFT_398639 [Eremomyces bilateralis CBS 781.70]|uniref:Mitochondrial K+-H+ exchange-related-domain-containing protein n=1 Tax=Eremomyces bilateralis CBS 781.70 TaxID=1392243 RepID=A0A6G1G136_9PEZI|nr:uncharacterized protein P152DRAFT_398639 [Eremomyces bilateralis CBS 781.70]KAF1811641.1 hypothetical protein P152DRAFT_398639 [Eremomyces bilateralis CBS 781.70]